MQRPVAISLLTTLLLGLAATAPAQAGDFETVGLRFSAEPAAPAEGQTTLPASGPIYAHADFGTTLRERMEPEKKVNVVIKLMRGDQDLTSWVFYLTDEQRAQSAFAIEVLGDPATSTQYNHKIPQALARLPAGKHELKIQMWSLYAKAPRDMAEGALELVIAEGDGERLTKLVADLKAAKRHADELKRKAPTLPRGISIRHDGVEILLLKDDSIVKDGAVVGSFDGSTVRRGGDIVGKLRDGEYRHEGADAFQLTKGHRYPGTEIRYEGAIIGAITSDGNITWEGAQWGLVKPFDDSVAQKTRVFVALFLFSNYFGKK